MQAAAAIKGGINAIDGLHVRRSAHEACSPLARSLNIIGWRMKWDSVAGIWIAQRIPATLHDHQLRTSVVIRFLADSAGPAEIVRKFSLRKTDNRVTVGAAKAATHAGKYRQYV